MNELMNNVVETMEGDEMVMEVTDVVETCEEFIVEGSNNRNKLIIGAVIGAATVGVCYGVKKFNQWRKSKEETKNCSEVVEELGPVETIEVESEEVVDEN